VCGFSIALAQSGKSAFRLRYLRPSVCLPTAMYRLGSRWTVFRQIWRWGLTFKHEDKIKIWLKSDKVTSIFKQTYSHLSLTATYLPQQSKENSMLRFHYDNGYANASQCPVAHFYGPWKKKVMVYKKPHKFAPAQRIHLFSPPLLSSALPLNGTSPSWLLRFTICHRFVLYPMKGAFMCVGSASL